MRASPLPIKKIEIKERKDTTVIPSPIQREVRSELAAGKSKTVRVGKPGLETRVYSLVTVDGKVLKETLVKSSRKEPQPTLVYVGRSAGSAAPAASRPGANMQASRSGTRTARSVKTAAQTVAGKTDSAEIQNFNFGPETFTQTPIQMSYANARNGSLEGGTLMTVRSTAYTPDAGLKNPTFLTATGRIARQGMIAVDPRVIPMHSILYVEGYGWGIAADTGGAIKGNKIDVCVPTLAQARQWGRRTVTILVFPTRVTSDIPRR